MIIATVSSKADHDNVELLVLDERVHVGNDVGMPAKAENQLLADKGFNQYERNSTHHASFVDRFLQFLGRQAFQRYLRNT